MDTPILNSYRKLYLSMTTNSIALRIMLFDGSGNLRNFKIAERGLKISSITTQYPHVYSACHVFSK